MTNIHKANSTENVITVVQNRNRVTVMNKINGLELSFTWHFTYCMLLLFERAASLFSVDVCLISIQSKEGYVRVIFSDCHHYLQSLY